jgi:hypothetical protein
MYDPDHTTHSQAEYGRVLAQTVRYSVSIENDAYIVRRTEEAVQRSRELLEATKHQVRAPVQGHSDCR